MISHSETRTLSYSAEQMFNLVSDIERYPEFIPWCEAVRINSCDLIHKRNIKIVNADMVVSFKVFRDTLTSEVTIDKKSNTVNVEYINGPFTFLKNQWLFKNLENQCEISFYVEFEFKSKIMQRVVGLIFHEAMKRIVKAFEKRARELYY